MDDEHHELYLIEDNVLWQYVIEPDGDNYMVLKSYIDEVNDALLEVFQLSFPIDSLFDDKINYSKVNDNHYQVKLYTKNYQLNIFRES